MSDLHQQAEALANKLDAYIRPFLGSHEDCTLPDLSSQILDAFQRVRAETREEDALEADRWSELTFGSSYPEVLKAFAKALRVHTRND